MYKRTLIREFIVQYLKDNTNNFFGDRILGGKIKPNIERENQYPYLIVMTRDEDILEHYTSHTRRELNIHIGVNVSDNVADDFDAITDNAIYEVEKAMSKLIGADAVGNDSFNLIEDLAIDSIIMDSQSDGRNSLGKALITYKAIYDYARPVGFDISTLVDFDELASVQNIIITNDGVPGNV